MLPQCNHRWATLSRLASPRAQVAREGRVLRGTVGRCPRLAQRLGHALPWRRAGRVGVDRRGCRAFRRRCRGKRRGASSEEVGVELYEDTSATNPSRIPRSGAAREDGLGRGGNAPVSEERCAAFLRARRCFLNFMLQETSRHTTSTRFYCCYCCITSTQAPVRTRAIFAVGGTGVNHSFSWRGEGGRKTEPMFREWQHVDSAIAPPLNAVATRRMLQHGASPRFVRKGGDVPGHGVVPCTATTSDEPCLPPGKNLGYVCWGWDTASWGSRGALDPGILKDLVTLVSPWKRSARFPFRSDVLLFLFAVRFNAVLRSDVCSRFGVCVSLRVEAFCTTVL